MTIWLDRLFHWTNLLSKPNGGTVSSERVGRTGKSMNEYKLIVVNQPEPERIASVLVALIANREGLTATDVKVVRK